MHQCRWSTFAQKAAMRTKPMSGGGMPVYLDLIGKDFFKMVRCGRGRPGSWRRLASSLASGAWHIGCSIKTGRRASPHRQGQLSSTFPHCLPVLASLSVVSGGGCDALCPAGVVGKGSSPAEANCLAMPSRIRPGRIDFCHCSFGHCPKKKSTLLVDLRCRLQGPIAAPDFEPLVYFVKRA